MGSKAMKQQHQSPLGAEKQTLVEDEIRNKRNAVFARGAGEFWVCDRKGNLEFFGPRGRLAKSRLCPPFPSRIAS
jgi:hypothetical protein